MIESMKKVIDDLDLSDEEKKHVKSFFNKIHEAFEALKNKNAKVSDSKTSDSKTSE